MAKIDLPKTVKDRGQMNIYVSEKNKELLKELKAIDPEESWSKLVFEAIEFYLQNKKGR